MSTWIQTYSGRKFYPLDPRPEDVDILDITHALSNACRFTGHCRTFYSVAQHCVHVSFRVPVEVAMWGLLHDATEAYICDMARPVKRGIPAYREIEQRLELCIAQAFGISPDIMQHPAVKEADVRMLATERRDVMGPMLKPEQWIDTEGVEPYLERITPWTPFVAGSRFVERFDALNRRRPS